MRRIMFKSKLHRVTVTEADLHYEGSCAIDLDLMEAADIVPYEMIQIYNINNGERFETYAIEGERGSGAISLNGAAARKGQPGDLVIIVTFVHLDEEEVRTHKPKVVFVDEHNRLPSVKREMITV